MRIRKPEQALVRTEKAAGMRLESERGRGAPERLRALERGSNDGAVPAMHAIEIADGEADVVWRWIDANGAKFGLHRPIPGPDPAHVQSRGDWHKLALGLRETRLRAADATAQSAGAPSKVAKASW